jgi:hypothetical protein
MTFGFILRNLSVCAVIFSAFTFFQGKSLTDFLHQALLIHHSESNAYFTTLISRLVEL